MSTDSCTNCENSSITVDCSVDAVIAQSPSARSILNDHNIDTCCGGRATLGDAALHAHVDPFALITLLTATPRDVVKAIPELSPPIASCGCGCR